MKITTFFKKRESKISVAISLFLLQLFNTAFAAGLPTMQEPTKGTGSGIFDTIKNYGYDAMLLAGLCICAYGFMKVAGAAVESFGEVRNSKKTWGEFFMICLVGIILLVVIIWLITQSTDILG